MCMSVLTDRCLKLLKALLVLTQIQRTCFVMTARAVSDQTSQT